MYTGYELLWLFFSASFLGWVLETASAALSRRKFTNRGIVNAPFCIIYGVALTVITVFCQELQGFWLFAECMILATVIEWGAGHMIERMYHERWWIIQIVNGIWTVISVCLHLYCGEHLVRL